MQIPEHLIKKWTALRSGEDVSKIAGLAGCTGQAVRDAFKLKRTNTKIFAALGTYYKEKAELLKEFI
jgi:hypothetical protein